LDREKFVVVIPEARNVEKCDTKKSVYRDSCVEKKKRNLTTKRFKINFNL
jgi:hypothetical protein